MMISLYNSGCSDFYLEDLVHRLETKAGEVSDWASIRALLMDSAIELRGMSREIRRLCRELEIASLED